MRTPEPLFERRAPRSYMRMRHRVPFALKLEKGTGVRNLQLPAEGTVNV
jgi:hypothetical protein